MNLARAKKKRIVAWRNRETGHGLDFDPHLGDGDVVVGAVEDGRVVVLVLDFDGQGADVLELRSTFIRGLHGHVDQLLPVGLVAVENL